MTTSNKVYTKRRALGQIHHIAFVDETGKSGQSYAKKFRSYIRIMNNIVDESEAYSKSVTNNLDVVAKNIEEIGK